MLGNSMHFASLGRCQRPAMRQAAFRIQYPSMACPRPRRVQVQAMQSGWNPQQQQQQQPMSPQPMSPQPQQQMGQQQQQPRQQLARSPTPYQPAGPVFLDLTQVLNKQVITRTSGRCLGTISGAWLDPAAGTLVSFDLDERKAAGTGGLGALSTPPRAGNIPLSALRQIGDVVLVHDESGLYEQDLDGRLGFVNPVGLDVRTRAGEFLGKVRDLSFSPDSGAVRRITYDEFGLPFLPLSFFDCYSVAMPDVLSIGRGELLVYDDAKYRERKESAGLFAAIPSLFKSLNSPGGRSGGGAQLALPAPGGTSDMYRLGGPGSTTGSSGGGSGGSRFLPTDYTYEQWQADLRRWEAETGMTYEQYLRTQQSQQPAAAGPRNALPPAGRSTAAGGYGAAPAGYGGQQQQQQYPPQQQRQPGYMQPQQQQQQQPMYQQQPGMPAWQQPQGMPQQQQQYGARPSQQQYAAAGMGQQPPAAGFGAGQNPAGMQGSSAYPAAGGNRYAGAAGQQQGFAAAPQQAQQQQPPQQQRAAAMQPGQQQQQQPQQQQQQPAGAARAGTLPQQQPRSSGAGAGGATGAAQRNQQQQQPAGSGGSQAAPAQQRTDAGGRPVNDWLERDTRPRIADALADGVLPSSADAPAPPTFTSQQPQQQEVA